MDLLEQECIVISTQDELFDVLNKYRIPVEKAGDAESGTNSSSPSAYIVSRVSVRRCGSDYPNGLTVFKSAKEFELHLFKEALFGGKIVVNKGTYRTYLKTIRLLKKVGIKTIRDRTYFEDAYSFYVKSRTFKELDLFGCKVIVSMTNGIQFNSKVFLSVLKKLIKDRD